MSEKERFINKAQLPDTNISAVCREFGISRKTGYKLLARVKQEGLCGLNERSRQPHRSPLKTEPSLENLIVEIRKLYPTWGGKKLKQYLMGKGFKSLPTEKTIDRILKRYGLITTQEVEKQTKWNRFEHEHPNDLWQMDFKGHFAIKNKRCHPLTLLDDHSRFSLRIKACYDERSETVQSELIHVFREYGLPARMTMDNGSPWGYSGNQSHTQLTAWLIRLGIYISHSRPNHPQTQGKLERFHRTLKLELLNRFEFQNFEEVQSGFDWWRKIYNEERPHEGIQFAVPAKRYKRSERCYPEKLPTIEYDDSFTIRKVQQGGFIHFKGKDYRIGQAFHGYPVGLKEGIKDGLMDVYFCHQKVVVIDLNHPCPI